MYEGSRREWSQMTVTRRLNKAILGMGRCGRLRIFVCVSIFTIGQVNEKGLAKRKELKRDVTFSAKSERVPGIARKKKREKRRKGRGQ